MNHKDDVYELFGIQIVCRKSDNTYHIADRSELKDAAGFKRWVFDALSLSNQLSESSALRDRVLLEDNPSGHEFVATILEAMRNNKKLIFGYKGYNYQDGHISRFHRMEPYALKYFKRRWYLLAKYLSSLPLHHSQKVVEQTKGYTIFSYFLRITYDFKQELLALGDTTEVLYPKALRKEMATICKKMAKRNA